MKLNKLATMLASELIGNQDIDQSAETIAEIVKATDRPERTVSGMIGKMVSSGQLEKVWKRTESRRLVPAYRQKRNK